MRIAICSILLAATLSAAAQIPDKIYAPNIHNVKLNPSADQTAYPVMNLGGGQLDLNFDDLNGGVRSYSYTWQLCNADWTRALISEFDYIKGFTQNRINTYRTSSIATVKYTHYMVTLPERSCMPSKSGNYLLKVFADGDTANLLFTRRVLVLDDKIASGAVIQQPFNGQIFKTHQKIQFTVNLGSSLNTFNPMQQVKVVLLQNWRWDNCIFDIRPTMVRQNVLEFNTESDAVFPGGREWRWLDLRSFRLLSDRVKTGKDAADGTTLIEVKTDLDRSGQRLVFYKDNNGRYYNDISESVNYLWQADYAKVHFSFVTPSGQPMPDKELFLFGELTNYGQDEKAKMIWNPAKGVYETDLLLKNGYYDYAYITTGRDNPKPSFDYTEGNFWETENDYTILVYYRGIGGRTDELVGLTRVNSLTGRSGY
ncbi:MAG: DUF5103 domain-containing protein [Bacteroidetes bacterium]|nr:DUF5103 domain-containing protein [Bacteroidota bacterium]